MAIDPAVAVGAELPEVTFSWSASDVALYHLAVGAARDPLGVEGLRYVDDANPKVLPTFATVAASFHATQAPAVSFPGIDIDLAKVVHGSQQITAHQPLPPKGKATTRKRIVEVQDKGSAAVIILLVSFHWATRAAILSRASVPPMRSGVPVSISLTSKCSSSSSPQASRFSLR